MSTSPDRASRSGGAGRSGPALLAALLCVLPLVLAPGAARPAAAAAGIRLEVTTLTPAVATSGTVLQVAGTVTNRGDAALRDAAVRLRLSQTPLGSRSELAAVIAGQVASRDGEVVAEVSLGDLAPGTAAPFDLQRALDDLDELTVFGVHVLGVEVVGTRGSGAEGARVALTRSLLPWAPASGDLSPTGFSWVWPLAGTPSRLADGIFADDSLAGDLAPGGRLDRLLTAGRRLDQGAALTWAIDPELVEAVQDMADAGGYQVRGDNGRPVAGGGSALAQQFLDQLQQATAGAVVLALPYGDPDLVALVRHGAPGEVARARTDGQAVLAQLLPSAIVAPELAWPVDGYLDRATLAALARSGATTAVLDGRALPATIDLSYTPSGRARLASRAGPVAGLLADPVLTDLLAQARPAPTSPVLAAQRVVAETAMVTAELPSTGTGRTIVAMPPRRWAPSQTYLDQLVAVGSAPWAAPVSLRELAASRPPEVDRERLRYPRDERQAELPESYLVARDTFRESTSVLAAVLEDGTALVPGLLSSQRRLASSWWRGRPEARSNRFALESSYLSGLRTSVTVQPGSFTFGSKTGKIPITLVNDLPETVNVVLRLRPQTPRLRLSQVQVPPIGPGQKIQVEVPATAVAGGPVVVDATLHTPGGAQLQTAPVALRINVTEIGAVALYITVAAAVVLFLAAGIRVVRRVRGSDDDGDGPADPDDPAEPAGRTADVTA